MSVLSGNTGNGLDMLHRNNGPIPLILPPCLHPRQSGGVTAAPSARASPSFAARKTATTCPENPCGCAGLLSIHSTSPFGSRIWTRRVRDVTVALLIRAA